MLEIEEECRIPEPNWYVNLLFDEGYFCFQTIRQQQLTRYKPYLFNAGVMLAAGGTSGWTAPADANGRFYLEPQEEETIYQVFLGISPSQAKLYLQYTQRVDRMNLITPRTVPGDIGYWDGYSSPYDDPAPFTELWSVHQLYPHFNVENPPVSGKDEMVAVSFWVTPYTWKAVTDKNRIKAFLRKEKPSTIRTMGDGDRPIRAPAWLTAQYGDSFVLPEEV